MVAEIGLDLRRHRHVVLLHQVEKPLDQDAAPEGIIDMAQRLEPQVWTAQVMPAPPEQIGEQPSMPVEVEQLGDAAQSLADILELGRDLRHFLEKAIGIDVAIDIDQHARLLSV